MIPKRLRWMAVGAAVSYVSKRKAEHSVDRAAEKLEEYLPEPLAKIADGLPADVVRSVGAVVATGNAVRSSASLARTAAGATGTAISAGRTATGVLRSAGQGVSSRGRTIGDSVTAFTDDLKVQTELQRRELKSDYVRHTEGDGAALEALLDRREPDDQPLPETPEPVAPGRRRFRRPLPAAPVNRVQRTYRPPTKPWDRSRR